MESAHLLQSVAGSRRLYLRPDPDHGHRHLTEGQRHNNLKSYSNRGIDYRYCVSYYRGRDKKKVKKNGEIIEVESEIDLIIEENGVLYPIEIKQGTKVSADEASAFPVLDKVSEKKRGTGAIICTCPVPGMLRDNLFQIPVWYIWPSAIFSDTIEMLILQGYWSL